MKLNQEIVPGKNNPPPTPPIQLELQDLETPGEQAITSDEKDKEFDEEVERRIQNRNDEIEGLYGRRQS